MKSDMNPMKSYRKHDKTRQNPSVSLEKLSQSTSGAGLRQLAEHLADQAHHAVTQAQPSRFHGDFTSEAPKK